MADDEDEVSPKRSKACGTLLRRWVWTEVALACGTVEGRGVCSLAGLGQSPEEVVPGTGAVQEAACGTLGGEEVAVAGSQFARRELACGLVREEEVSLGSCWADGPQQGTQWEDA